MRKIGNHKALLREFRGYLTLERGLSAHTADSYEFDLQKLLPFLEEEHIGLPDVTYSDLENFAATLYDLGIADATRKRILAGVKSFFHFLKTEGFIQEDPSLLLETPRLGLHLPEVLTVEEIDDMINAIDHTAAEATRNHAIIETLYGCGMRVSELVNLEFSQLMLNEEFIIVHGKGNKERMVYLNDSCKTAIKRYLEVRPHEGLTAESKNALFISRNHKRISPRTVEHIVTSYIKKAGLDGRGLSTHKLRHTAATLMYRHGHVDIRVLKDILGHANLGTTQIYTHVSDEQIKAAIDSNPLSEVKSKNK